MPGLSPRLERFAAAFASAAGFSNNPPLPVTPPAPDFHQNGGMQIMRTAHTQKKDPSGRVAHLPISSERKTALHTIRWCYSVANLRADSPRLSYYVSRWDAPGKVARALAAGTFDELTANCPPIDPARVRFVPAALEAHRQLIAANARPKAEQPKLSGKIALAA